MGVGWDLALVGLTLHVSSGAAVNREEAAAWTASEDGRQFTSMIGPRGSTPAPGRESRHDGRRRLGGVAPRRKRASETLRPATGMIARMPTIQAAAAA
jgi:hypothetical protein